MDGKNNNSNADLDAESRSGDCSGNGVGVYKDCSSCRWNAKTTRGLLFFSCFFLSTSISFSFFFVPVDGGRIFCGQNKEAY